MTKSKNHSNQNPSNSLFQIFNHLYKEDHESNDLAFSIASSDENIEKLNQLKELLSKENVNKSEILSICFFSAANSRQTQMLDALFDMGDELNIKLDHYNSAFNIASELGFFDIMTLINERTGIIDQALSAELYLGPEQMVECMLMMIDHSGSVSLDLFKKNIDLKPLLLIGKYATNVLDHAVINNQEATLAFFLDQNCNINSSSIVTHFITSCHEFKIKSAAALINHPKSRALINASPHVARYFNAEHHINISNTVSTEMKNLLESVNFKEKLQINIQQPQKTASTLKI